MTLVDFIKSVKTSNITGWRKWLLGGLAALAMVLVIGGFFLRSYLRNKALAQLKHEHDVATEQLREQTVLVKLAEQKKERDTRRAAAQEALDKVKDLENQMKIIEEEHHQHQEAINSLNSWKQVDDHVH